MLGIEYMRSTPTTWVLQFKNGHVKRSGTGLSFLYYAPTSTIVAVPLGSIDLPFVFNEPTADFQTLRLQGQLSYRIVDPKRIATLLDYSLAPAGAFASDDPKKLDDRLAHAAQVAARAFVGRAQLRDVLGQSEHVAESVLTALRASEVVSMLGLEVLSLAMLAIRPTPEMGRALEAEARELLLRRADEAIYARRNAAIEQERVIRENELRAEIAVEEKKRQIRETQVAAEIAVEQQRSELVDTRVANERKEADAKAYALEIALAQVRSVDWRTLTAVMSGGNDPKLMIGLAFRELAENAQMIGEINITPDLLQSLTRTAPPHT